MNAVSALLAGTRVGNALDALVDRYEAAQPSSPDRSIIPAFVRDARFDANGWTRYELTRKIRDFDRNIWLVGKLKEVFTKYTVGPAGLKVHPGSSDDEWNKRAEEAYEEWCETPCRDSLISMATAHKLIAGSVHIDGEIFILKTRNKLPGQQSTPAIQLIESHRCSSPGQAYDFPDLAVGHQDEQIIDGVQVDPNGRPIGYWIRDSIEADLSAATNSWAYRGAGQVIHVFEPDRPGMYRAVSPYHAVLNSLHDLDDLEIMEMQRAKQNAENAFFVKSKTGELRLGTMQRDKFNAKQADAQPNPEAKELSKRIDQMRRVVGSRVVGLKLEEDVVQQAAQNPSAATQWYWRYKVGQVCSSIGIPLILVMPESIQGTVARSIYDDANAHFRAKFNIFAHTAKDIYRFWADWARYNVKGLQDGPADWRKCHVVPPRAVNVDVGRNSAAMIAELAAGITNLTEIAGASGSTAEQLIRRKANDIKLVKKIAKEVGVEPAEIMGSLADILQKLAAADAATEAHAPDRSRGRKADPEDEDETKKEDEEEIAA